MNDDVVEDITSRFKSVEQAKASYVGTVRIIEGPDYVSEGWTLSGNVWKTPSKSGHGYDVEKKIFISHEEYRKIRHSSTDSDVMEALRKIREGDTSYDWQGWLDKLDAYNKAVSDTKNQPTYPDKVKYPQYPTK